MQQSERFGKYFGESTPMSSLSTPKNSGMPGWQGDFKWHIYRLSHMFDSQMSQAGQNV